jgi:exosortase H (IPTLxxWG-CTERM-specific)
MSRKHKPGAKTKHDRFGVEGPAGANPSGRLPTWIAGKGPVFRFVLCFGALMGLYYALALTPYCDRLLYSYLQINARATGGLLNWLGQNCRVDGVSIRSAHFAIAIRRGCDAIEPAWFFCAALIAFPGAFKRKILGMLIGVSLLLALNLVRIVSLYFIGWRFPGFFDTAHVELWPLIFILMAMALWLGWIPWMRRERREEIDVAP